MKIRDIPIPPIYRTLFSYNTTKNPAAGRINDTIPFCRRIFALSAIACDIFHIRVSVHHHTKYDFVLQGNWENFPIT